MKKYDHLKIEGKWQKEWDKKKVYQAKNAGKGKKFYGLVEFPYPSGAGLHVGHIRSNTAMDIISRKRRMEGYNVLYPMGWDAFGLPTENFAIKTGIQPAIVTKRNTDTFRKQLKSMGFSFDWSREVNTTDPAYYKWTQWIFLEMYKKGLAYKAKSEINWCPKDKIGLANEEAIGGVCDRCGGPTEKRVKEQWMLAITKYADRLDKDLDGVNYLDKIKIQQRNWIGKSEGLIFSAKVKDSDITIQTFSAHYEACFADTFFVIAPDHPLLDKLLEGRKEKDAVLKKAKEIVQKRDTQGNEYKDVDGVFTGRYAIDPLGNGELPIWVASFALKDYGTGIVKCSAHDERDFAFANKFNIKIKEIIIPKVVDKKNPPQEGKETVERNAIQAIIINPKDQKVLCLKWKKFPWTTLVVGGIEGNEDPILAARREVLEETGYKNLKYIKTLGGQVESHFYAAHKGVNRKALFTAVVFDLENEERVETSAEEKSIHDIHWMTWDELGKDKNLTCSEYDIWVDRFFNKPHPVMDGVLMEPLEFKGREIHEVRSDITRWLVDKGFATKKTTYKLRDWVFSRQRYWGEPIPLINCGSCGWVPVPVKDLPVTLPKVKSYAPTDNGESPLATISSWVKVKCPNCKGPATRETDTMPNWAGSSWYYLRYTDPKNKKEFASKKNLKYFTPVDWYNGGMEHTTLHLLYSRFWHKFLYDLKLVPTKEPYAKRTSHGMILAEKGEKMSKSKGNVVNPDDLVKLYGADTLRMYEMFMGPFDQAVSWSTESMIGPRRFLERVWKIYQSMTVKNPKDKKFLADYAASSVENILHKTIKKVTEDIENMNFNTSVSSMMILVNEMDKVGYVKDSDFKMFLQMLAPFAPHITEEIWRDMGEKKSIHLSKWPKWNKSKIIDDEVKIVVQVNGKVRTEIMVSADMDEESIKNKALNDKGTKSWIDGKEIKRVIYVKGRLINIVV
ncbi:MAG: class I tRNA ligase family protein [bacterium]